MTAICPTRNRRTFLPKAIECFLRQTYPLKELVVVEDGAQFNGDLIPAGIRYVRLEGQFTTGWKRNYCCHLGRGDVIAHWDDDDWSHPERLAEQVAALESGAEVTGYHSMAFDGPSGQAWLYRGYSNYALGTSLCYRRRFWQANPFPDVAVCEDEFFVRRAQGVVRSFDGQQRMVATTHAANTSPRLLSGVQWAKISRAELPEEYLRTL